MADGMLYWRRSRTILTTYASTWRLAYCHFSRIYTYFVVSSHYWFSRIHSLPSHLWQLSQWVIDSGHFFLFLFLMRIRTNSTSRQSPFPQCSLEVRLHSIIPLHISLSIYLYLSLSHTHSLYLSFPSSSLSSLPSSLSLTHSLSQPPLMNLSLPLTCVPSSLPLQPNTKFSSL